METAWNVLCYKCSLYFFLLCAKSAISRAIIVISMVTSLFDEFTTYRFHLKCKIINNQNVNLLLTANKQTDVHTLLPCYRECKCSISPEANVAQFQKENKQLKDRNELADEDA